MQERVAILGASNKPDRYAYLALKMLCEHGHCVVPIHPTLQDIDGIAVLPSLPAITEHVDTLTLYVGPAISSKEAVNIIALKPGRVIFNPGTENPDLQAQLNAKGIPWREACTLVLLRTGQW